MFGVGRAHGGGEDVAPEGAVAGEVGGVEDEAVGGTAAGEEGWESAAAAICDCDGGC